MASEPSTVRWSFDEGHEWREGQGNIAKLSDPDSEIWYPIVFSDTRRVSGEVCGSNLALQQYFAGPP